MACYIRNRCYIERFKSTAYEKLIGSKPNFKNLQLFGSKCYSYIKNKTKLDERSEEGIFVGYDSQSPSYLIYFPEKNSIKKVRVVKFISDNSNFPLEDDTPFMIEKKIDNEKVSTESNNENIQNSESTKLDLDKLQEESVESNKNRYPVRNKSKPKYLDDYVSNSVEYAFDCVYRILDVPNNFKEAMQNPEADIWIEECMRK